MKSEELKLCRLQLLFLCWQIFLLFFFPLSFYFALADLLLELQPLVLMNSELIQYLSHCLRQLLIRTLRFMSWPSVIKRFNCIFIELKRSCLKNNYLSTLARSLENAEKKNYLGSSLLCHCLLGILFRIECYDFCFSFNPYLTQNKTRDSWTKPTISFLNSKPSITIPIFGATTRHTTLLEARLDLTQKRPSSQPTGAYLSPRSVSAWRYLAMKRRMLSS